MRHMWLFVWWKQDSFCRCLLKLMVEYPILHWCNRCILLYPFYTCHIHCRIWSFFQSIHLYICKITKHRMNDLSRMILTIFSIFWCEFWNTSIIEVIFSHLFPILAPIFDLFLDVSTTSTSSIIASATFLISCWQPRNLVLLSKIKLV